jgi:hypothetical protein
MNWLNRSREQTLKENAQTVGRHLHSQDFFFFKIEFSLIKACLFISMLLLARSPGKKFFCDFLRKKIPHFFRRFLFQTYSLTLIAVLKIHEKMIQIFFFFSG